MVEVSTCFHRFTPSSFGAASARALSLSLLAALGCAAAPPPPAPPSEPPAPSAVIGWARGPDDLAPEPPSADRLLLALPANKPIESNRQALEDGTRVTPSCLKATSFLPAPKGDPRIYFLVSGQIFVRRAPGQDATPLAGNDPALGVTRLLACDIAASPLELLVAAKPQGATAEELWLLTIAEPSIQAATPLTQRRTFTDLASFFTRYSVPRCLPGGRRCLVLRADDKRSYLDVEPTCGKPEEPFQGLGNATVLDAAWASADGQSLYLLMPCP